jgi:hypothetical protein
VLEWEHASGYREFRAQIDWPTGATQEFAEVEVQYLENEGPFNKLPVTAPIWPIWLSMLSLTRRYEFEEKGVLWAPD